MIWADRFAIAIAIFAACIGLWLSGLIGPTSTNRFAEYGEPAMHDKTPFVLLFTAIFWRRFIARVLHS